MVRTMVTRPTWKWGYIALSIHCLITLRGCQQQQSQMIWAGQPMHASWRLKATWCGMRLVPCFVSTVVLTARKSKWCWMGQWTSICHCNKWTCAWCQAHSCSGALSCWQCQPTETWQQERWCSPWVGTQLPPSTGCTTCWGILHRCNTLLLKACKFVLFVSLLIMWCFPCLDCWTCNTSTMQRGAEEAAGPVGWGLAKEWCGWKPLPRGIQLAEGLLEQRAWFGGVFLGKRWVDMNRHINSFTCTTCNSNKSLAGSSLTCRTCKTSNNKNVPVTCRTCNSLAWIWKPCLITCTTCKRHLWNLFVLLVAI